MALPFFYTDQYDATQKSIVLNEETSKHVIQVLRMKIGEQLNLTDGKGNLLTCSIANDNRKHCEVEIASSVHYPLSSKKVSISISLLKNTSRYEWFLEKVTEIGVREIIPLICERTEKEKFRHDRLNAICISAMLQSQQCWLPVLREPVLFRDFVKESFEGRRLIAHCELTNKQSITQFVSNASSHYQMAIGPEGDFTNTEIELALQSGFVPVSLGETRLRTETAGVVAATMLVIN